MESKFSQLLLKDISKKIMEVPFSQIEDSEFISKKEEALFPITTLGSVDRIFRAIPNLFHSTILLVSVLSILLIYEPLLMVVSIILAVLGFSLSRVMIRNEAKLAQNNARNNSEYVYYLRTMRNPEIAKDVRIYKAQPFFVEKLSKLYDYIVKASKVLYQSREYRALINQILSVFLMIFIYSYLIVRVTSASISSAIFILLINAAVNFNDQINVFLSELLLLNQQLIYLRPLVEFYDMLKGQRYSGNLFLDKEIKSVEFRNVYFRYPKTEEDVLKGCSFKLENCKNLSIVGRNGSGKTTIIKLLSRLYEPQSGEILVNGVNINKYEEKSYLKQLSIIFQDFKTFHYSLRENIVFDSEFNEARFECAIEQSELSKELHKFPKGIDTKLSDEDEDDSAISLSKGQEQKLVIGRSIYGDGSLLILDEPTASLDPIAEEQVYQHFRSITENKLAIFISHRLSSCRFSDTIIYLEDGRVSEVGSHGELMNLNREYASLFNLQASKYQ
ncbi:ATP-binding cassette domain-containing protein [Alloiococcus sp. CFN-8]|uniref:ATP-binding cassette domain-containing protein n=1 Tax=Alloiococcus sp. CFN-8 TaxID=3416081 RepID=UPI003CEC4C54